MSPTPKSSPSKITRAIPRGRIYVTATFNNTIVSITDEKGNVVCWASTGAAGFSGSRKSSPYAATVTVENAVNKAKAYGMHEMELFLKGPGPGRDAALRVLRAQRIHVSMVADMTPVPHNGTKPRKQKHNR
jgi:small subunit ribosomal protein S11